MEATGQINTHFVPRALRNKVVGYRAVLPAFLNARLSHAPVDAALPYISGALKHQEHLLDEDSRAFYGQLHSIEFVERRSRVRNTLIGRKAVLHIRSEDRDNRPRVENITTPWIEYAGGDIVAGVWDVALGKTLLEIAEKAVGHRCGFLKAFDADVPNSSGHSGARRWLADIWVVDEEGSDDAVTATPGAEPVPSTQALPTDEYIRLLMRRDGLGMNLNEREIESLTRAVNSEREFGFQIDAVADAFGLPREELGKLTPDPIGGDHIRAILTGLDKALVD